jgi:hypothetical protein
MGQRFGVGFWLGGFPMMFTTPSPSLGSDWPSIVLLMQQWQPCFPFTFLEMKGYKKIT